jgi:hypothetical protein
MRDRLALAAACAAILAAASALAQQAALPDRAEREAGSPRDEHQHFTADEARQRIEAAGWDDVRELHSGHGDVWHAVATRGGLRRHVVLLPDGRVALVQ